MNKNKTKEKQLIKLFIYLGFLLVVILLSVFTGAYSKSREDYEKRNNTTTTKMLDQTEKKTSYIDKVNKLINGPHNYSFKIKTETENISYEGSFNGSERIGYRENKAGIIKYREKNDDAFIIENGKNDISFTELYTNLDKNLFNFQKLFDKLNSMSTIKTTKEELTTNVYNDNDYTYKIYSNSTVINKIEIVNDKIEYAFTFTY